MSAVTDNRTKDGGEGARNGPLVRRLVRWFARPRVARWMAFLLLGLSLAAGAGTYAAFTGVAPLGDDPDVMVALINLDLVLLLLLGVVVTRRVVGVWAVRRRGSAGSKLYVKLVMMFGLLSVAPAIVVAIFSWLFFDLGLESWFSDRVRTAVSESREVAQAYLDEHQKNIRTDALRIARDLNNDARFLQPNPTLLNRMLEIQLRLRDLSEAIVFEGSTRRILARAGLTVVLEFEPIKESAVNEAAQGEVVILTSDAEDRVRAIIKLDNYVDLYLYIGRLVDPKVLQRIEQTKGAVQQFERLEGQRSDIKVSFALAFVVVSLLLLLTAVWIGLNLAGQLSQPISTLIGATEKVRAGDLEARVPEPESGARDDELGLLSRAFNRMTAQLHSQRGELLEANKQIDERRRFTEAVLAGVSAGVIGLDGEGRIDLPNRSASDLLGLELDEHRGEPLADMVPEMADLLHAARARRAGRFVEAQIRINRDGYARTLLVRVGAEREDEEAAKPGSGGAIQGFVVTFDDVSLLLAAQRKAAWADVARRIAHEIKNPLTPIQLSAERLKRKYLKEIESDPETFANCTDTIVRHVGDIGRMVDEFSSFARMPAPTMNRHDVCDILRQAVFLQRNANQDIEYGAELPGEPVEIRCDARQLSQVVTNLLQNAYDAIEGREESDAPPGRIMVRLSVSGAESLEGHDDADKMNGGTRDGWVLVEVEDNGRGLPAEDRERLTEPYVTTRAKGTGLGLAIVKKIMEDHGGTIDLSDAPSGRGALVRLALPFGGPTVAATPDMPMPDGETPDGGMRDGSEMRQAGSADGA
ncbi:PAS domain-containing sensor histidine kinase [Marivibrio halodurans]|uniref:Nitrogen regulation protein n=1 Tax=Marivibrio halodurans TaxID=2039722 RepID=A0A8J7RW12_9PROT|nr:PAS domain-containing sensor histidine kinase [Marivibrio halodurans]MBP5855575.1 PAS domain-containing sensor histidine kinase [Marivibrio halodurans]